MRFRGVVLAGLVAVTAAGCGDDGGSTIRSSGDEGSPYWVATDLPAHYRPLVIEDSDGQRTIRYGTADDVGDVYDADLAVRMWDQGGPPDAEDLPPGDDWGEEVRVHGHDGWAVDLQGDGVVYGTALHWEPSPGLWLSVEASEPLTRAELDMVAEGLVPVDEEEWARLTRALSIDTHVGRVDPDAVAVEAAGGEVDGERWTLTALVPGDYPLGPEDRRRSCYRLAFRGESSDDLCDAHPWRLRLGGQVFAFGFVVAPVERVRVVPIEGDDFAAVDVDTFAVPDAPPQRFFVAPLPDDACFLEVVADPRPLSPGPTGPMHTDPDRAACMAARGADTSGPLGISPPTIGG